MASKYYAVAEGRGIIPSIYSSWAECQPYVKGVRAVYKGFEDQKSAIGFILKNSANPSAAARLLQDQGFRVDLESIIGSNETNRPSLTASVSAKYDPRTGIADYLVTIKKDGKELHRLSGSVQTPEMRHIDAELAATKAAIEYAKASKEPSIQVLNKYDGISKWASGEWKAKNRIVHEYVDFVFQNSGKIQISFGKL